MLIPAFSLASPGATRAGFPSSPGLPWLLANGEENSGATPKRTVRVRRRRRTETPEEGRKRAEAPRRRRTSGEERAAPSSRQTAGQAARPAATQRPSTGLPARAGALLTGGGRGRSTLILVAFVLIAICVVSAIMLSGPGDGGGAGGVLPPVDDSQPLDTPRPALPTNTQRPFTPPAPSLEGQTWLVMLYQDADDKILEQDIYVDLNEAERAGSSERVHIVAQVDRYRAGFQGDGDWSSTKRFYITQNDDLERVGSQLVADLGEVNMADGQTLVDFVTWAIETFPADKHVLIMSDHGMGWPGGWSDPEPRGSVDRSIPLAAALGDELFLMELDEALGKIRAQTGLDKFELIGMDACLMGHLEVFSALAPHARYAVASQETEPALGWAYTSFLDELQANPDMDGAELGRLIVGSYIEEDQRIVDDGARAEMLRRGSPMGGLASLLGGGAVTAEQLADQMGRGITLSAVDLTALGQVIDSVNDLSYVLQEVHQPAVARARTYAQSFTSIFGKEVPPSYIDLGSFVQLLKREASNSNVSRAADAVLVSLDMAIIAERHGPGKPGATGMSVYFPNSQLFRSPVTGPQSYTAIARRFADVSLWDDFLAYHYTGRTFEPATATVAVPEPDAPISAPGAGEIEVSSISLSDDVAAPGRPIILSADISGENVGYVLFFTGFFEQESNSVFVADRDYLESADTREMDGVYYPDWGEGAFTIEFEWEPLMFAISDGTASVVALLTPQRYGESPEDAIYTVDGTYTYADGGESRYARLYFRDGILRQVFGFTNEGGTGAPREIIPQSGDTFTVLERWLDLDERGQVAQAAAQEGNTLVFSDQMFTWEELDAAPGQYVVGFIVEDLDGNAQQVYAQVTVE